MYKEQPSVSLHFKGELRTNGSKTYCLSVAGINDGERASTRKFVLLLQGLPEIV
jgi:hypothetical protein